MAPCPETSDTEPSADYKVYLDMQMNMLANHPDCAGIYGVMAFSAGDEEYARWIPALYRHYCIEGRTDRLSRDPYELRHLRNPDFRSGLDGWSVAPAEDGGIQIRSFERFGWLEGRFVQDSTGDRFLVSRRGAARPNTLSQTIDPRLPGRRYHGNREGKRRSEVGIPWR